MGADQNQVGRSGWWPDPAAVGVFLLVVLGHMAMGLLGMGYAGGTAAAPIWPAAGVAMAALIVGGLRFWPAIWIAAFAESLVTSGHLHWVLLAIATGATLGAVVPVLLMRRMLGIRRDFQSPSSVVGFTVVVLLVGCPVSAIIGTGSLNLAGGIPDAGYLKALYNWWIGDAAGVFLVCPLIVSLASRTWVRKVQRSLAELGLWTVVLSAIAVLVFFDLVPGESDSRNLAFLTFPLIVGIAWSFGTFGAAWATFLVGSIAIIGTELGRGALMSDWAGDKPGLVLVFIISAALASLLLGAYKGDLESTKERVLQRDRQLSQAQAIGGMGSWFWETDTDNVTWSAGSHRLFGLTEDSAQPKFATIIERVHPDDRAGFAGALAKIRATGETATWESRIVRPDGEERILLSTAAPHDNDVAGTTMDITQRKRINAQQMDLQRKMQEAQKLESLGVLAGGVAHDFNNILTGVLGYASLLRLELPPDSAHVVTLRKIEASAERAADLCKQMLAYAGKGSTRMGAVNLNRVVRESWALLRSSVKSEGSLEFDPAADLPAIIADTAQIRQVVINLVVNATEALANGAGEVRVRTGVRELTRGHFKRAFLSPDLPDGAYVCLEVADTGGGMSKEIVGRIFDPFFTTKFTGRGLGLPAVAGIVRTHNGAIFVQSREGRGTVVEIAFPTAKATPPPDGIATQVAPIALGPGRVLVVDDEHWVRDVASEVLSRAGFSVDVANDGMEAVELVRANPSGFSFVLIDLTMPRLGGVGAITQFRAAGCMAPVIVMSGFDREETLGKLEGCEIAGFVSKPFTPEALQSAVRSLQGASGINSPAGET